MDKIKQLFPLSFRGAELKDMIISILLYIAVSAVAGIVMFVIALIPIIGLIVGILGAIVNIYTTAGIVIAVLNFLNVLK